MKLFKRLTIFIFAFALIVTVVACNKSGASSGGLQSSFGGTSSVAPSSIKTTYEAQLESQRELDLKIEKNKLKDIRTLSGESYQKLVSENVITTETVVPARAQITEIESVATTDNNLVIVTFNGYIDEFDPNDIKIRARYSDWYSLNSKVVSCVEVSGYSVAVNAEGKTVIVLQTVNQLDGIYLSEDYLPVSKLNSSQINEIITRADNVLTWQIEDNGGWDKDYELHISRERKAGESYITKGSILNGLPLGTIDNTGTYTHMRLIASAYALTGEEKYKKSFAEGLKFLGNIQYSSGGFAQFYPLRKNYSDLATFNDHATYGVLTMYEEILQGRYPFNDIVTEDQVKNIKVRFNKGIEYIIKSQIIVDGVKTAWCAQNDPFTYEPKPARAFEPISIASCESVKLAMLLLNQRDNPEAIEAGECAIAYLKQVEVKGVAYDKEGVVNELGETVYFYELAGSSIWYRFYEIGTNKGLFGDRDGQIYYNISQISSERRLGYAWADDWATKLISRYENDGYFPNRIVAYISSSKSKIAGGTINKGMQVDASRCI